MNSFADKHPETLRKVLKSLDKAIDYMKKNREESISVIAKMTDHDYKLWESIWDSFEFELSLDNSLFYILEDEGRWVIQNKYINKIKISNYQDFIYLDAMKIIKPGQKYDHFI